MKWLLVAAVLVTLAAPVMAAPIQITDPNFSVAAVQGLTKAETGACLRYRIVDWNSASLYLDAGGVMNPTLEFATIDVFAGVATNIKPIDQWLENAISLDTTWGVGWLFRAEEPFAYVAASIHF